MNLLSQDMLITVNWDKGALIVGMLIIYGDILRECIFATFLTENISKLAISAFSTNESEFFTQCGQNWQTLDIYLMIYEKSQKFLNSIKKWISYRGLSTMTIIFTLAH